MLKKIVLVFLFCMMLVAFAVADEMLEPYTYISDFSTGLDGWYALDGAELSTTKDGSLLIVDKPGNWNAVRDIDLIPGMKYEFSVDVYQKEEKEAKFDFGVSGEMTNLGLTSEIEKGKWKTVYFTDTVRENEQYRLWVQMCYDHTGEFRIRNFIVRPVDLLIEGMNHQSSHDAHEDDGFYGVKTGDILSNECLSIQILRSRMIENSNAIEYMIIPRKSGISEINGRTWIVLPQEKMPEELLGGWTFSYADSKDVYYYSFNDDGTVAYSSSHNPNGPFELLRYVYSKKLIWVSDDKLFDVRNGVPILRISHGLNRQLKKDPQKIQDTKVKYLSSCSITYQPLKLPGIILMDPTGEYADEMFVPVGIWENAKPRIYTNGSVQLISSNPEILEMAGQYSIWIYLRGLKPGAADVSVLPNGKNAKQSNSISFTVVEGEKKLPENLVGTRWVKKSSHYGELSLIFNQSGQFFLIIEFDNSLEVKCGHYLYYDGMIQLGCNADNHAEEPIWFTEMDQSGETILYCNSGNDQVKNNWRCEPLLSGQVEYKGKTYLFTEEGIPLVDNMTWDEMWQYTRHCQPVRIFPIS